MTEKSIALGTREDGDRLEVFTLPGIFHMESIWNGWIPPWIPWIPYGILLGESSAIFSFHPHHGFHMEWYIPHGFHGLFQVDSIGFHSQTY